MCDFISNTNIVKTISSAIKDHIVNHVIPANMLDENTKYFINPSGSFVVGGPLGDAG